MTAISNLLEYNMVEGDDHEITWTIYTSDGVLFDFTNVTKLWFTVKENQTDADSDALIGPKNSVDDSTEVTYGAGGPGAGKVWVHITDTECTGLAQYGALYFDIQCLNDGKVNTILYGRIAFEPDITVVSA